MRRDSTPSQGRTPHARSKTECTGKAVTRFAAGTERAEHSLSLPTQTSLVQEPPIQELLVPTDFSSADARLFPRARMLAQVFEMKATLLHVIDINDPAWLRYSGTAADFMRQLRGKAHQSMNTLAAVLAKAGVEITTLNLEGLPWEEITHALKPDSLLLIRKPTAKPFWRLFSKRTLQRVLAEARCALMVCPT